MSSHLLCCKDAQRTLCNQNTSIIGGNTGDDMCYLCQACFKAAICHDSTHCNYREGDVNVLVTPVKTCDECDCAPCRCDDICDDCGCVECECEANYPCGCEPGCGCADCWDCHYDQNCECDDCLERGTDDRFSTWSDRFVWRQVFLDEGCLSDRAGILKALQRNRDYNYATVCDHDGNMRDADQYHRIMAGFRSYWRNNNS